MNSMSRGVLVLALSAFALGGCAGTSGMDLKTPTDAFATAATAAQTALQSYDNTLDAAVLQDNTTLALSGKGHVAPVPGDCGSSSKSCHIVLTGIDDKQRSLDSQPSDPTGQRIMAGVVTYATSLQAIVAIDTEAGVKSATDTTLANISQFATTVNPSLGAKISPFLAPINDAATLALGAYLDSQKLAALARVTSAMDTIFPELETTWEASPVAASDLTQTKLSDDFNKAQSAYVIDHTSAQKLAALQAAAAAYNAFLALDPKAAFAALTAAHKTLTQALHPAPGSKPDFAQTLAAIQRAVDAAQRVITVAQEFQAAAHPAAAVPPQQ